MPRRARSSPLAAASAPRACGRRRIVAGASPSTAGVPSRGPRSPARARRTPRTRLASRRARRGRSRARRGPLLERIHRNQERARQAAGPCRSLTHHVEVGARAPAAEMSHAEMVGDVGSDEKIGGEHELAVFIADDERARWGWVPDRDDRDRQARGQGRAGTREGGADPPLLRRLRGDPERELSNGLHQDVAGRPEAARCARGREGLRPLEQPRVFAKTDAPRRRGLDGRGLPRRRGRRGSRASAPTRGRGRTRPRSRPCAPGSRHGRSAPGRLGPGRAARGPASSSRSFSIHNGMSSAMPSPRLNATAAQ